MKYIEIDYLDSILMNALEEIINKCDGYEPYYCDSHNDSFIQCALVDDSTDSPVMYGFVGLLINDECGYVEVSGLVAPDFRHRGHFRNMLSICYRKLKSSSAGNLELIAPISGELLNCSLCGDVCFYEYLYQLDKAHFNLKSIQAAEPDNAEYYLEGDDYLMYLPEYEERKTYGTYYWDINGNKVTEELRGDDSRIVIDRTLPFIDRSLKQGKPFLATIWFHTPHLPCVAGPEHAALYSDLPLEERNYYGCITAMDEQIERLVNFLKRKGIYENTVIFFCSDNGPELNTPGTAGIFKGKKRSLYEGGIRVPAFMVGGKGKLPGHITQPCSTSDYLPTILEMTGLSQQGLYELDGESFLPFLSSEKAMRKKPLVFCSGTQGAVVTYDYKLYYNKGKFELYKLPQDPSEQNDISASHPDEVKKLSRYLHQQMSAYRNSFEGEEYGTSSVERMKQKWEGIFAK